MSNAQHKPVVAFDFSGLDHLNPGNGQFRYCTDLIKGLAAFGSGLRYVVLGSRATPPEPIAGLFTRAAFRYVHVPPRSSRGAYYLDQVRYGWLLRRERVDLFHTPHTFLPRLTGARAIVTVLDLMTDLFPEYRERFESRTYRRYKAAVQRNGTHVIAISRTTAADLERLWRVPRERISTVYLGFDNAVPSSSVPKELLALTQRPFVLSPYNLEPRKNLQALVSAFVTVRQRFPELTLVLYGRAAVTPDRERAFQQQLDALGIRNAVMFTGFLSDEDLAWLYRAASMFVFPSLYEGFGIPVLEALSAGACVIARNQSAMAEVIGNAGLTVETQNPAELAAAMTTILGDPQLRMVLNRAAEERARQFSLEAMTRGTITAYLHALGFN